MARTDTLPRSAPQDVDLAGASSAAVGTGGDVDVADACSAAVGTGALLAGQFCMPAVKWQLK